MRISRYDSQLVAFCPTSKFRVAAERSPLRCPETKAPLEYTGLPSFAREDIDPAQQGQWRYAAMLPVIAPEQKRITLGEGWTPLIEDEWDSLRVYWKLESLMPTGSYKDRGVSVMINWLLGLGASLVVDDSSGNAGASVACYAGRADLSSCIFVPETAPAPKKSQIVLYGAELAEVPGPRDAATDAAVAATHLSKGTKYASHALHPAFLLGQMTCAWEIWEQMGYNVPDWFVTPVGHGGLLLGVWRGFQHLRQSGLISKLPHLVAVQAEPYTPIYDAFHNGWAEIRPQRQFEHVSADGISINFPVRHASVLNALHHSNGTAISVTEDEVLHGRETLASRGLFVEPTSATVAAALTKLQAQIPQGDKVAVALTGHGLKRPPEEY